MIEGANSTVPFNVYVELKDYRGEKAGSTKVGEFLYEGVKLKDIPILNKVSGAIESANKDYYFSEHVIITIKNK